MLAVLNGKKIERTYGAIVWVGNAKIEPAHICLQDANKTLSVSKVVYFLS